MKKLVKWFLRLGVLGLVLAGGALFTAWYLYARDLPDVETLRDVQLQVPLRVLSADGQLISVFGEKRRIPVAVEDMPEQLKLAFIAGEDARFYEHPGVDYQGLTRAVITLATTGEKSVGGSTITQMLARNFFLTLDKTYERKIREIFLALKIERSFSKDEILELFLNKILLGHRAYGVGAAAEVYYGRRVEDLTLAQCAMIAALPKAPSRINPITSPERALERRDYVLSRMRELGHIDEAAYRQALAEPDNAFYHGASIEVSAPYVAEMARVSALAELGNAAYTGGYVVHTTIDGRLQTAANDAVRDGLEAYDRRHGYRGPEAQLDLAANDGPEQWQAGLAPYRPLAGLMPGLVTEADESLALVYLKDGQTAALNLEQVAWAKKFISRDRWGTAPEAVNEVLAPGDVIRLRRSEEGVWQLSQLPDVEGALVSVSPQDGAIRALVGGYDYARSKYNRITQSRRQPGSSFKPFLYSAALENGYTTATLINDAPIVFEDTELERTWKPQNFSEKFFGPTRMREAMVNSRNLVSIRMLRDVGLAATVDHITRFGFAEEELPANLSMALGTATLHPLAMARGYSVFANGGHLVEPYFISRIDDASGNPVYFADPALSCDDCMEEETADAGETDAAFVATEPSYRRLNPEATASDSAPVLEPPPARYAPRVISEQNAYLVRSMMNDVVKRGTARKAMELGRTDLAGKTGTTNDQVDAWFSGYNSELVTSVWVGFDDQEELGRNEVGGRAALPIWMQFMAQALQDQPDAPPDVPAGIVQARINPETGLLAALDARGGIMEVFEAGHMPDMEPSTGGVDRDGASEENPYDIY